MKLWGGRFTKPTSELVDDFQSSIRFDWRLFKYDIRGSQAHARMLAAQGVLTSEEADTICRALDDILAEIEAGKVEFRVDAEDIHMNIESLLIERAGDVGKKLHTARSRNDQVALDIRLYLKDEIKAIDELVRELQEALLDQADANAEVVMPGYTHLQRAQPILFSHHMLAYFEMLQRDRGRLADCFKRTDVSPLGAGALAGVTYPIDRSRTAYELGFAEVAANSLDAVSDRDFAIEFSAAASMIMMHISRLSEEIILWTSQEFGFVVLDDAYSTGSSIMPQKKNPDVAELSRGKTGRVYGDLMTLLTVMKGLPLAYNKDMQEDKEALFDVVDTVTQTLRVFAPMVRTLRVRADRMAQATQDGFLNATDLADYLAKSGVPFREAHAIVGRAVLYCTEQGRRLEDLSLEEFRRFSPIFDEGIQRVLSVENCVSARNARGGTAPEAVERELRRARQVLRKDLQMG